MISNIFRKLLECLSFFYKNNLKLVKKTDPIILKTIKKKLNRLSSENKNLKKTHNIFNKKIILSYADAGEVGAPKIFSNFVSIQNQRERIKNILI